jgi:WD repeat-containing protein 61
MVRATTLQKVAAHEEGVWAVAWLPNSSQLLTGSVDESVKLWSLSESSLEPAHAYTGHALGVISLDVEPSGAYAVTSSLDSMVRVFGIEDKTTKHMLERPPTETWQTVFGAVTPETTQLAVAGGSKGQVYTYRGSSEEPGLELTLDLPQVGLVCIGGGLRRSGTGRHTRGTASRLSAASSACCSKG